MPMTSTGIAYDRSQPRGTIPAALIHAGVADRRMWDPQWDAFSGQRDLLRLDLRGFGASDTPPAAAMSHTDDVLATMDAERIATAHLVGSSLGSSVAVEVALRAPSRVATLLLCPPGGDLLQTRTTDLAAFITEEDAALARGDLDAAVEANVRAWVVGPGRAEADVDAQMLAKVRTMQLRAFEAADALTGVEQQEMLPPAVERLGEIGAPTLILVGGWDLETTRDAAERVHATIRQSTLVAWPDAAHLPSLEHPARFTDLLSRWLAQEV